jgi:hypothetical protein
MSFQVGGKNWLFSTEIEIELKKSQEEDFKKQQETIQENSWLQTDHPLGNIPKINVNFKTLCLLDGKSFIKKTPLEGSDMKTGLEYFHAFTDHVLTENEKKPESFTKYKFSSHIEKIARFREEVENAIKINDSIVDLISEGNDHPEERANLVKIHAQKLQAEFKKKKQGWFPCSWQDKADVIHSVMIHIDLEKETVTLINAGKETDKYHPKVKHTLLDPLTGYVKEEEKFQEFIKISNVNKNRLKSIDFFKYLVELQVNQAWYNDAKEVNERNLYESLPAYLEGSIEEGVSPLNHPEVFKKADVCNSGSMKCLSTMLYYMFCETLENKEANNTDGIASYKQLKYLWQTHILMSFFKKQEAALTVDEVKLLKDIIENVSRSADKLYKASLLSEIDLKELHATFLDIQNKLAMVHAQDEEIQKTEPAPCNLSRPIPNNIGNFHISLINNVNNALLNFDNQRIQATQIERILNPLLITQFSLKDVGHFLKNLKSFKDLFQNTCQEVKTLVLNRGMDKSQEAASRKIILEKFSQFICELPGPSDPFWNNISEEQITDCMEQIFSMMQILKGVSSFAFRNRLRVESYADHEAEITAMLYALYSVNVRMARLQKQNCLEGYNLYQDLLAEVKSPHFVIENSKLQQKLQEVISYFNPEYNLESQVTEIELQDRIKVTTESLFAFKGDGRIGNIQSENSNLDRNATFRYYKQFLKDNPELRKKLYHPDNGGEVKEEEDYWENTILGARVKRTRIISRKLRSTDTEIQHLEALIGDVNRANENRFLPRSVYILQDSALLCLHHHYISGNNPIVSDFANLNQNQFSLKVDLGNSLQQDRAITVRVDDLNAYHSEYKSIVDHYLQPQLDGSLRFNNWGSVLESLRGMKKQNSFIPTQEKLFNLELDASRELLMIGVDPYDAVARLIGFGRHNIDFLEEGLLQSYFRLQLFRNGQLLSQMEDQRSIAKSIGEFFVNAIEHHRQKGDIKTCLSLAKLGNDVKVFITQAGYYDVILPDFRKIIREKLIKQVNENHKLSQKEKWAYKRSIYETLVTFYEKIEYDYLIKDPTLQSDVATDILGFLVAKNMEGQAVKSNVSAYIVQLKFKALIVNRIQDGTFFDTTKIFDSTIKLIDPTFNGGSPWKGGPRVYYSGKYIIDIEEGNVIDNESGRLGTVPSAIIDNVDFKKVFKGSIETCKQNGSLFLINEGLKNELTVYSKLDGELGFERKIKEKVYRYIPFPEQLAQHAPTLADSDLCCWVYEQSNQNEIMIALKEDKKIFKATLARTNGNPNTINYTIVKLEKKDAQQRRLKWVPSNCFRGLMDNFLLKGLNQIANPLNVECWVNGNSQEENELAEIKALEFGLSFTTRSLEGKTRLFCQQYPGYYLVENPKVLLLGESFKYFTLENFAGERKVLIPHQSIVNTLEGPPLIRQVTQAFQFSVDEPIKWLEYELKEEGLQTRSVEGRFAQIILLVARGNYEEAFNLLKKTNSLERFTDDPAPSGVKERSLILQLMRILALNQHPAAQSMLLHLIIKTEENRLKFPLKERRVEGLPFAQEEEEPLYASFIGFIRVRPSGLSERINSYEKLIYLYKKYLSLESNSTIYRLTERQKKTFLNLIDIEIKKEREATNDSNEKMMFRALPYFLQSDFHDYLKTGKASLGMEIESNYLWRGRSFNRIWGCKFIETDDLRTLFEDYDPETKKINITKSHSVIVQNNYFRDNFFALYHLACSGTEKEKKQIIRLVKLNSHLESSEARIIERVCTKSTSYPTVEELAAAVKGAKDAEENYNKAQIKYQELERESYNYTDNYADNELERAKYEKKVLKWKKRCLEAALAKQKSESFRNALFDRIPLSFFATVLIRVQALWKEICILLGKFSFTTRVINFFSKRKRYDKPEEKTSIKIALNCDGQVLEAADQKFDDYFSSIIKKHFSSEEEIIIKGGDYLPSDNLEENIKKKIEEENVDLLTYRNSLPETVKIYYLKKDSDLDTIEKNLQQNADSLKRTLKTQKAALLWQVNQIPEVNLEKTAKEINKIGQSKHLSWEDIRQLTLSGSVEIFEAKTHLGEKETQKVMLGVSDYLIKATRLEQIYLTLKAIDKAKTAKTPEKKKMYLQNVVSSLKLVRIYKPSTNNMHQQWFEFANHYLYRGNQLEKLREITSPDITNILAEMPTGYGKTDTMIPGANYEKALKGWLIINTWPASLEMINAANVKHQMETSFGRMVERLTFDRATNFTLESLKFMHEEIIKNQKEGIPINICSETLRSLELHCLLGLKIAHKGEGDVSELKERLTYFIKILREIRRKSWASIDESHVTLDPKDKLIYTNGDPTTLTMRQIDIIEECFCMLTKEPLNRLINISGNQQGNINEDVYNQIALVLAEHFEGWLKLKLSPEEKDNYKNFVLGKESVIPDWLKDHPLKADIALLKGQLTEVLKTSFKGFVDENFGLSKLHFKEKEYAISYANANTPKETKTNPSQFKNPHETMNKTYLVYLNKGLEENQIEKLIKLLQDQADEEALEGTPLNLTNANKFFLKIAPTSAKLLKALTPEDIKDITPTIKNNKDAIFYYIRHIITPQLKIFPEILVSSVHNFKTQFCSSLSLSATPQATATHGVDTQFIPMKGTSGQVTHLLLTKCKDVKSLHSIKSLVPEEALNETLDIVGNNTKINATIDIGAYFKGLSNKTVAEKMRDHFKSNDDMQAIIFFDDESKLFKIMDIATGHLQDPADSQIDPDACLASYDQNRCFGSDLKLAVDAIGLLMSGKNTTKAIAGQGGGRMRQWHDKQSVEVVYPEDLLKDIFTDQQPNIKQLLVFWLTNQVRQEEDKNYHSQEQQMDNEIRRSLLDKILGLKIENPSEMIDEEVDVKEAIKLFDKYQDVFFSQESNDPWEMYGSISEDKPGKMWLEASHQNCIRQVDQLSGLNIDEKEFICNRLNKYPAQWETIALPNKVKASTSLGMECEVLQEVNIELERQNEVQVREDLHERTPSKWPENLDLFTENWMTPTRQSFIMQKLIQRLAETSEWICNSNDPLDRHMTYLRNASLGFLGSVCATSWVLVAAAISTFAKTIVFTVGLIVAGAILALEYGHILLRYLINGNNPIFKLKDLAQWYLPLSVSNGAKFFSPDLLVSNNFYIQTPSKMFEQVQKPFNIEQKPLFEVLVIQEEKEGGNKDLKLMLIDQNDQVYFRQKLKKHREQKMEEKEINEIKRKIGIFDIQNGIIVSEGKNGFKDNELEENSKFQELLAQVKFMSGEINYTDKELAHIRERAKKTGISYVSAMFENHILPQRPLNKKCLKRKPIAIELGIAVK